MTKIAHFVLTTEKTLVEGVAKLFWDHIWKLYRLPESIIIDIECQRAKLRARIKPTALCLAFDKENSMEFSLIPLPTYTLYYCGYALTLPWSSCYSSHVTPCDCDL